MLIKQIIQTKGIKSYQFEEGYNITEYVNSKKLIFPVNMTQRLKKKALQVISDLNKKNN